MTESRAANSKPAPKAGPARKPTTARATPAKTTTAAAAKSLAAQARPGKPAARHPNLGLAPSNMTASYPAAAEKLRSNAVRIAAVGLEGAVKADPTITDRYDEVALRRLLRDGELMVERLSMCLGSGEGRWLADYAEWIGPIYRRRGVPLGDLGALCAGLLEAAKPYLTPDEAEAAGRALDGAMAVFKRNGRLGGDRHKRNALWKWMYRGV